VTCSTRKLAVIVAALIALILAASAGAIVRYTVFTVTPGNWALRSGTDLYCHSQISSTKHRSFFCFPTSQGKYALKGTYSVLINKYEVSAEHATDAHGDNTIIRRFVNPQ
jgi:hypothetical protein